MKMKRMLTALLATILAVGALGGCKGQTAGASSAEKTDSSASSTASMGEPVEISFAYWDIDSMVVDPDGNPDKIFTALEENTNVTITPVNLTWDDFDEKVKLWATSSTLPDIFVGYYLGTSVFGDWKDQGIIKALPQDISAYPNLKKYLDGSDSAQAAKFDDQYYCIPRLYVDTIEHTVINNNIIYRWDLAQKAGVSKEPETWDEFRDMLDKIIASDSEGKGVSEITGGDFSTVAKSIYAYGGVLDSKWVLKDGQWSPNYFSNVDGVKAAGQLARDLYTEGLIDKDIALNTYDNAIEKFLQGKFAAMACFYDGPQQIYDTLGKDYKNIYNRNLLDDIRLCKVYPAVDGNKYFQVTSVSNSETYVSSGVTDEKMAGILRLFDYLFSDEGNMLVKCGFEGTDWEESNGERKLLITADEAKEKYNFYGSSFGNWGYANFDLSFPSVYTEQCKTMQEERLKEGEEATIPAYSEQATLFITPLRQKFQYNTSDDLLKIMVGQDPVNTMVDTMMTDYKNKGLDAMLTEYNELADKAGISKE